MNQSYYHKLNSSLTPGKNKQSNLTQLQLNISKQIRDSTDNNKKSDSLLNILIKQQQQAIQSDRQFSIERSIKKSPLETSPYIQKNTAIVSSSLSFIRRSTEQSQMGGSTQFDRLLNENTTLLMKIQELEQKNSLLQMKCQSSRKQDILVKKENITNDKQLLLQINQKNENENRILKELINRQTYLMHIPSVLQTLSLIK
ncbi:unnamed protein product [Paramecium pentaurelia]|uniref:Uncharacterized protein n=1 Tax=Paramecium pentaurelia TaxID=43138 RepID=A0A8S1W9E6_9CILI|nr:unnamed protein product [Paramecium pentaurelia]